MEEAETREVRAVEVLEEQRLAVERKDGDVFTAADSSGVVFGLACGR